MSSSSFMADKLRIPEKRVEEPAPKSEDIQTPKKKEAKTEKPWVGTAALRELSKKRQAQNKTVSEKDTHISGNQNRAEPGLTGRTNLTELTGLTEPTKKLQNTKTQPTSPVRDFTKTPNSIARQVMANGLFRGKSKQIYDFLWTASRGAIVPSRTVRRTHGEIQGGTGIGSLNTIKNGLKYLEQIGLINKTSAIGEAFGNSYEIFTPEEINLPFQVSPDRPVSSVSPVSPVRQEMVQPVRPESGRTNLTQPYVESTGYSDSKTLYKTNTNNDDDSARINNVYSAMIGRLDAAARKLTGKSSSKQDSEKWEALAELLILELEVAAKRSGSVSSVPAFLTEVLRRQFFAARQQNQSAKSAKAKPDTVGKSGSESFEIKPLDEQGREAALEQLREFSNESFLEDFAKWYTPEDWQWLTDKLNSSEDEKQN